MTNADRIRAMKDEELAAFIDEPKGLQEYLRDVVKLNKTIRPSFGMILVWLRQEAE